MDAQERVARPSRQNTVAVKVTDMLGEEVVITKEV